MSEIEPEDKQSDLHGLLRQAAPQLRNEQGSRWRHLTRSNRLHADAEIVHHELGRLLDPPPTTPETTTRIESTAVWLSQHDAPESYDSPDVRDVGYWLAKVLARRLGPEMLHRAAQEVADDQ